MNLTPLLCCSKKRSYKKGSGSFIPSTKTESGSLIGWGKWTWARSVDFSPGPCRKMGSGSLSCRVTETEDAVRFTYPEPKVRGQSPFLAIRFRTLSDRGQDEEITCCRALPGGLLVGPGGWQANSFLWQGAVAARLREATARPRAG